jgi:hypothetical protein
VRLGIYIITLAALCLTLSCREEKPSTPPIASPDAEPELVIERAALDSPGRAAQFLFLGHVYERFSKNNATDPRVVALDKSGYDGVWYGGDLTPYSIGSLAEQRQLDSILDLSDETTLWARGNHDWNEQSEQFGRKVLGKKSWQLWTHGGLGVFCYNSSLDPGDCDLKEEQWSDLQAVLAQAHNLECFVFLSHHAVWANHADSVEIPLVANAPRGKWGLTCDPDYSFELSVWPTLTHLSEEGVQVLCLSGDAGTKENKSGYWKSPENVEMLICGIYNSFYLQREIEIPEEVEKDQAIVFTYYEGVGPLEWEFVELDSLGVRAE